MLRRLSVSLLLGLTIFFSVPLLAHAQDYGLDTTAGAAGIPTTKGVTTIIGDILGTALSLVSVLFFALMLYAGIKWMLARGDDGEAAQALDTIVAAIIGLVIVLASYAITTFVFKNVGGGAGAPSSVGGCNVWQENNATQTFCDGKGKDQTTCQTNTWCKWDNGKCLLATTDLDEAKKTCPSMKDPNKCNDTPGCEWK